MEGLLIILGIVALVLKVSASVTKVKAIQNESQKPRKQLTQKTRSKSRLARRLDREQCMSVAEFPEDEESFDTELHEPLSMPFDEEMYFSTEIESNDQRNVAQRQNVKRTSLQKIYIYNEIFSTCKGWDD